MIRIDGKINVEMTLAEANNINALLRRDRPMAMKHNSWEHDGKEYHLYYCPVCNEGVYGESEFCKKCGQRLDGENIAL